MSDDWDFHWRSLEPVTSILPSQAFRHRLVMKEIVRSRPNQILDVGCGQGDFLMCLSHHFESHSLAGIDQSLVGVLSTKRKVPSADIRQVDLTSPRASQLERRFDLITLIEVLEHVDEPVKFLCSALEYLKPGGVAVITVPSGPRTAFDKSIGHRRHFDKQELASILKTVGIVNIKVRRLGFPFFDMYRLIVLLSGKYLVDAANNAELDQSKFAHIVMRAFSLLLRANPNFIPFGLQLIATGKYQNASTELATSVH